MRYDDLLYLLLTIAVIFGPAFIHAAIGRGKKHFYTLQATVMACCGFAWLIVALKDANDVFDMIMSLFAVGLFALAFFVALLSMALLAITDFVLRKRRAAR